MSCSPFDLRDYFLEELPRPQERLVEAHVKTCETCREELDRLRIVGAALRSTADEEIPQRIAFVSDKIFEPSPWRRRLAAFWNSGARLGFTGAAMLSASLLVFAFRPAPAPVTIVRTVAAPAPASATQASVTEADIERRIQNAVDSAVAAKTVEMTKEIAATRTQLLIVQDQMEYDRKRLAHRNEVAENYGLPKAAREDKQ